MNKIEGRKKLHHYVNVAYLNRWRDATGALHVLAPSTGHTFRKTGDDIGAQRQFNDFTFDPVIIDLLHYAFSRRLAEKEGTRDAAEIMLSLIRWAKDADYTHKEHNFFEDFYALYESDITKTLTEIVSAESLPTRAHADWGLNLLFFYFLQLFRVPKAREMIPGDVIWSTPEGDMTLSEQQKREFTGVHMLINALCAACDVHALGYTVRLKYAVDSGKLINSDSPAVVTSSGITQLEQLSGWMPLTPRIAMELDGIGRGIRAVVSTRMDRNSVERYNVATIRNAREHLFFSSASQLTDVARKIVRKSPTRE
ncbi:MAG: DUF4238 domain-containing protein [Luteibacter sp.]